MENESMQETKNISDTKNIAQRATDKFPPWLVLYKCSTTIKLIQREADHVWYWWLHENSPEADTFRLWRSMTWQADTAQTSPSWGVFRGAARQSLLGSGCTTAAPVPRRSRSRRTHRRGSPECSAPTGETGSPSGSRWAASCHRCRCHSSCGWSAGSWGPLLDGSPHPWPIHRSWSRTGPSDWWNWKNRLTTIGHKVNNI